MSLDQWADLSKALFWPTTFLLYFAAMIASFYSLAFTKVARDEVETAAAGMRARNLATGLTVVGLLAHLGHLIARSQASGGRVPWGNMFEFSSVAGFLVVAAGLFIFQWRMKRPEVMGFLLFAGVLSMGTALVLFTEPGPLQPILNSEWLKIHVFTILVGFAVFVVGFTFNGLYLLRDKAESRVAAGIAGGGDRRSIGAAYAPEGMAEGDLDVIDADEFGEVVEGRDARIDQIEGRDLRDDEAYATALREAVPAFNAALWSGLVGLAAGLVFVVDRPSATIGITLIAIVGALLAQRFIAALPSAATLDSLAYRTIAFGFPIWTFAVLAGAVWAEQSWGRYWAWDPKETSAFLTWVAYAAYLHARATRGVKGRSAALIGMGAFGVLWFTYFVVNLFVTGLHSYAGI